MAACQQVSSLAVLLFRRGLRGGLQTTWPLRSCAPGTVLIKWTKLYPFRLIDGLVAAVQLRLWLKIASSLHIRWDQRRRVPFEGRDRDVSKVAEGLLKRWDLREILRRRLCFTELWRAIKLENLSFIW